MLQGAFDHLGEPLIPFIAEADIARIDPVLRQGFRAGRVIVQQLVTDVMKIADDGNEYPPGFQLFADMGDGPRGFVAIHGHPHDFGPGSGQGRHLPDGRVDIGGIRIRHGLHDDRRAAANLNRPDLDADGTATRPRKRKCCRRCFWVIETVP